MKLPALSGLDFPHDPRLVVRENKESGKNVASIVLIALAFTVAFGLLSWSFFKAYRAKSLRVYLSPFALLQRKWRQWRTGSREARYNSDLQTTTGSPLRSRANSTSGGRQTDVEMSGGEHATEHNSSRAPADPLPGVDRTASVRSVMTLPAYSPAARPTEQILGREGERGGVDVVIEYPETAEEEEERREQEMESLYQVRLARRRELEEREQQRRLLREARERGDTEAVAALRRARAESAMSTGSGNLAATTTSAAALLAEHQAAFTQAERRVPSVQYGDLGVARHDGTRLRAGSVESSSDSRPLLDSAASIGGRSSRADTVRRLSGTSVQTSSSRGSVDEHDHTWSLGQPPPLTDFVFETSGGTSIRPNGSRANSTISGSEFDFVQTPTHSRGSSSVARELGRNQVDHPEPSPPEYDAIPLEAEEAPPYESPVESRPPLLPLPERLPSIRIQVPSPADDREGSPRL